jgi:hypothetical protein
MHKVEFYIKKLRSLMALTKMKVVIQMELLMLLEKYWPGLSIQDSFGPQLGLWPEQYPKIFKPID